MNDLHNNVRTQRVLDAIAIGANATKSGKVVDRQGYGSVEFIFSYGAVTVTGAIVTAVCKEGDATGSLTSVADSDLLGTEALASLPVQASARTSGVGKNVTKRLGYKGSKRYVTVDMVSTGTTSVGCESVVAVLGHPVQSPAVQTNP